MCYFKLIHPRLASKRWNAFDSDDESSARIEVELHATSDCSGHQAVVERSLLFATARLVLLKPLCMAGACQRSNDETSDIRQKLLFAMYPSRTSQRQEYDNPWETASTANICDINIRLNGMEQHGQT